MQANYAERLAETRRLLQDAEYIVIGGGAGLSSAAGLTYAGERFTQNFADFIKKYGMTDMYTASFYPFATQEEKWAYWSRHIFLNRYAPPALPLYQKLYELVREKEHFVLTTNVDYQFHKAGFAPERIFAVQGDYGKIQCAKGCHDKLYDNEELVHRMVKEQKVTTITGKDISIQADSVCVHGDGEKALLFVEKIRKAMAEEGITISPLKDICN